MHSKVTMSTQGVHPTPCARLSPRLAEHTYAWAFQHSTRSWVASIMWWVAPVLCRPLPKFLSAMSGRSSRLCDLAMPACTWFRVSTSASNSTDIGPVARSSSPTSWVSPQDSGPEARAGGEPYTPMHPMHAHVPQWTYCVMDTRWTICFFSTTWLTRRHPSQHHPPRAAAPASFPPTCGAAFDLAWGVPVRPRELFGKRPSTAI